MSLFRQFFKYMGLVSVLALTACSSTKTFSTQVNAFNNWPSEAQGKLYAFSQDNSHNLEKRAYENLIAQEMWKTGLMQTNNVKKAHYLVDFSVNVQEKERIVQEYYREPVFYPSFGWFFGDYGYYGWGNGFSSGFNVAYVPRVDTYPVTYRRFVLSLGIRDKSGKPVYQAQALTESESAMLSQVMPYLLASIFDDFPGTNTGPKKVVFDIEKSKQVNQPVKVNKSS
ncbi:DUF4136 domain-containing protein [Pelistega sp. NLN82]|uniref:DUF4136 domain-containing protein n=1 Tax=Pelistega ratti TaxID=2652177 RepID=A0A6L9Y4M9_9BURK|nr:DUF4136 domain-containing protein [Pelistega ratti]NEN75379.1 DUF4136 domain-containing protein [Pelistega ratti]